MSHSFVHNPAGKQIVFAPTGNTNIVYHKPEEYNYYGLAGMPIFTGAQSFSFSSRSDLSNMAFNIGLYHAGATQDNNGLTITGQGNGATMSDAQIEKVADALLQMPKGKKCLYIWRYNGFGHVSTSPEAGDHAAGDDFFNHYSEWGGGPANMWRMNSDDFIPIDSSVTAPAGHTAYLSWSGHKPIAWSSLTGSWDDFAGRLFNRLSASGDTELNWLLTDDETSGMPVLWTHDTTHGNWGYTGIPSDGQLRNASDEIKSIARAALTGHYSWNGFTGWVEETWPGLTYSADEIFESKGFADNLLREYASYYQKFVLHRELQRLFEQRFPTVSVSAYNLFDSGGATGITDSLGFSIPGSFFFLRNSPTFNPQNKQFLNNFTNYPDRDSFFPNWAFNNATDVRAIYQGHGFQMTDEGSPGLLYSLTGGNSEISGLLQPPTTWQMFKYHISQNRKLIKGQEDQRWQMTLLGPHEPIPNEPFRKTTLYPEYLYHSLLMAPEPPVMWDPGFEHIEETNMQIGNIKVAANNKKWYPAKGTLDSLTEQTITNTGPTGYIVSTAKYFEDGKEKYLNRISTFIPAVEIQVDSTGEILKTTLDHPNGVWYTSDVTFGTDSGFTLTGFNKNLVASSQKWESSAVLEQIPSGEILQGNSVAVVKDAFHPSLSTPLFSSGQTAYFFHPQSKETDAEGNVTLRWEGSWNILSTTSAGPAGADLGFSDNDAIIYLRQDSFRPRGELIDWLLYWFITGVPDANQHYWSPDSRVKIYTETTGPLPDDAASAPEDYSTGLSFDGLTMSAVGTSARNILKGNLKFIDPQSPSGNYPRTTPLDTMAFKGGMTFANRIKNHLPIYTSWINETYTTKNPATFSTSPGYTKIGDTHYINNIEVGLLANNTVGSGQTAYYSSLVWFRDNEEYLKSTNPSIFDWTIDLDSVTGATGFWNYEFSITGPTGQSVANVISDTVYVAGLTT